MSIWVRELVKEDKTWVKERGSEDEGEGGSEGQTEAAASQGTHPRPRVVPLASLVGIPGLCLHHIVSNGRGCKHAQTSGSGRVQGCIFPSYLFPVRGGRGRQGKEVERGEKNIRILLFPLRCLHSEMLARWCKVNAATIKAFTATLCYRRIDKGYWS